MKLMIGALLMSAFLTIQTQSESDLLCGKWDVKVPEAPYGYHEGELTFQRVKGKLRVCVSLPYTNLNIGNLEKEEYGYSCSQYIDGTSVNIRFIIQRKGEQECLCAVAEVGGQTMDVKLSRKK
ncbi:MAG: hypothetical protein U0L16_03065 [Phocaeicola sp.]|nr:hypothetical protein [Phocaeicola sp.]